MLQNDPAYTISATFPNDDNIGYSKNRVPAVPFNLPINVINFSNDGSTCPLIGDGSYIAIMLGDVDGSYSNYDADGELRGSKISSDINAEDIVLFDLQNSTISQENGNVLIDIPVTLNTNETALNALDFWMSYDESVLEFVEVSSSQMEMDAFANYNESNSVLRVTSSKDLNSLYFDTNSNISVLRFKVLNPCLEVTPDLFTATSTLLNGLPAGYDYSVRDYVVFTEITTEEIICENGAESFSTTAVVEGQNVVAYNWDLNGEEIAFGDNVSFEIGVSGLNTVSVEAFTEFGCVIVFSEEIFVNASPSAGFTIQSETGSLEVSLTNESTIEDNSILSYNWNFGDGNTSNLEDPTNVYGDYGIYEVTLLVTSENGCTSEVTQGLELITTVENVSATFTNVYPNPFKGELSVITNLDADIYVIDMLGKRVSITKTVKPNTTTVFDLSYLASGMYNLVVASENSIMTYKIVCK
jgi:PKD repeat protein